jgi:cellulose synthase/poly-beta-1,6-N-acetylglucosamine synthase-like glycosyltransferase/spore germination protein YaaH/peptidoglycan/xylan/chitin deacetylase (PgdA/CDA1 family)
MEASEGSRLFPPGEPRQVFYARSPARWKTFVWSMRLVILFMIFASVLVTVTVFRVDPVGLPRVLHQNEIYRNILNPDRPAMVKTHANLAFQQAKKKVGNTATFNYIRHPARPPVPVRVRSTALRAAFAVNWDPESYFSLRDNADKLTMVFPEWLFVADNVDTVVSDIDVRTLNLLREKKIPIVPMLSNYFNEQWNGGNVHRLIHSPAARRAFIASLQAALGKSGFAGVNVDFEALEEHSDEALVEFQKELYTALHHSGFLVTMDVAPLNSDYDLKTLQRYNDYLVVMAYDQHYAESTPGPVSDQRWFEAVLEDVTSRVDPAKVIVALPGYGYDWPQHAAGDEVTYAEALVTAKESEGDVQFDQNGYNLTYDYADDNDHPHQVWFTDAATTYNQMRTAAGYGVAGLALWRLGSEDPRLWEFYAHDLSDSACIAKPFDFNILKIAAPKTDIDFVGEGEILNLVASPEPGRVDLEIDSATSMISEERYLSFPTPYVVQKYGKAEKEVALTFDDGPSEEYTPAILDILEAEHVPAAFFVVGVNAESNIGLLRRIYADGFEIGNHTFTHANLAEVNSERTRVELNATRRLIETVTGHSTVLFRPPYNADSEPQTVEEILPVEVSREENYYTIAESIDPEDWQPGISADTIVARVIQQHTYGNIVLLHDAGGDRSQTVAALPRIINYFRSLGYRFVTPSELMGKTRDEVMPPVSGRDEVYLMRFNWFVVEGIYWAERLLFYLFQLAIILSVGRTLITGILAAFQKRTERETSGTDVPLPLVSVIIPAHNEEVNAVATVHRVLANDYPLLDVVFVDDGSTDRTAEVVEQEFEAHPGVRVFRKPNGGKASALNYGIARAAGEIVVCIDADTQLKSDAVGTLIREFGDDQRVGAVAGNTKVGNERNAITRWQAIEYITSQNFDRRAFDLLNAIAVVPGAIGAFRRDAVRAVGGFTTETLAEDCDLTLGLLKAGYIVRYSPDAIAYTEAPETVRAFLKQRFRWSFGIMQSLWKYRSAFFASSTKNLGWVALPNILFFQILLPLLSPLADLLMVVALLSGNAFQVFIYYVVFLAVDAVGAVVAFRFERENLRRLWWLLPQRFAYRQLMYWVLFRSILRAIKGELTHWGVLKRTGNVQIEA